ncbi:uncharacterized protein EV422DRAFT_410532 [Fimicolochytrium jonesii]|uniref:uncharacterized protein n=1 Tax=Fimicolochytrium jonesii TaxID=1396493 RepID=UPI0022FDE60F|nr:uncharacterized protein EV422DRAFT_410532 [Fimicolochytrium jonesii]KAI8822697.1 hypothetical protein EV422DRAFT_410532 [Fimicolochytrium jonesii]
MDPLLATLSQTLSNLHTSRHLRPTSATDSITNDPLYISLTRTVDDLERRVAKLSAAVERERVVIESGREVLGRLEGVRECVGHMAGNVPVGVPLGRRREEGKTRVVLAEMENHGEEGAGRGDTKDARAKETAAPPPPAQVKKTVNTTIAPVTVAEFESLPKYQVGRLTLPKLNTLISEFTLLLHDKHTLLSLPPSKMTKPQRDIFWEHKKHHTPETKGKMFITEKDVARDKEVFSKSAFRLDPMGRSVVAIMRALGRIREVRGGGCTRMVVL